MIEYFYQEGFTPSRMLSSSKSAYRKIYPENEVYFNANIFVLGEGKVWYGDIDVTKDREILERIASNSGKDLFIVREMDGRFENENLNDLEIICNSVCKISK